LKGIFAVFTFPLVADVQGASVADDDSVRAQQLRDKMITHLGGKQHWAALTNIINGSIQNRSDGPNEV
jgi:hypothetical protein